MNTLSESWWKCCKAIIQNIICVYIYIIYSKYRAEDIYIYVSQLYIQSVQSLSHVLFFATPWTAACQASLSITNTQSLLKLMSIESVMPFNHFVLCHPLLLLLSIFPSIRDFSNQSLLCIRCGSTAKESACKVRDLGSIPELERSPGKGKGFPLQYSSLENSMDCIVHGVAKSWT